MPSVTLPIPNRSNIGLFGTVLFALTSVHLNAAAQEQAARDQVAQDQVAQGRVSQRRLNEPAKGKAIAAPESDGDVSRAGDDVELRFSFDATPWRDVIHWLSEETESALFFGDLPPGSFTYSDPNAFSAQEAIDRVNLFLLPQGYTLVRSGKLISVINLGDPRSRQQLDALAKLISTEELERRTDHDVVKCIFKLGQLEAEDAVGELSSLQLMTTPVTFTKTNQIMITDTVAKLKNVKTVLDAFQPQMMSNGTVVKSFALQHVEAEDVLVVARPHLGLATGEMIGIDVSLSADIQGKHLFVTGVEDKVTLIENLVASIDKPEPSLSATDAQPELRSHVVQGGNTEIVYNVLQTMLSGKDVRLSMDEETGSVVALATPNVQKEISETITQLQASDAEFAVIPLKWADPYFVISLLDQMLKLTPTLDKYGNEIETDIPKVDADPANMRLFVRGKKHQIDEIKKIVEGLDVATAADGSSKLRILPMKGKLAESILATAATFWREPNPIILYQSSDDDTEQATERVAGESTESPNVSKAKPNVTKAKSPTRKQASNTSHNAITLTAAASLSPDTGRGIWLAGNQNSSAAPIRCQLTARGLLTQSDDPSALEQFEQHLRTIAGPIESTPSPPIVFYLKYAKADDAIRMLAELLDGGVSAQEAVAGSLVNGFVSSASDMYFGSIVTSRDGTTTMMADTMTVVADSRLNRLIAQGTTTDIERIEAYLKVIDKDNSITEVETHGKSQVIELQNTRASEVAVAIREAFPDRVAAGTQSPNAASGGGKGESEKDARALAAARQQDSDDRDKKSSSKKSAAAAAPPRDLEPKMTVTVHEPSNSLIVTAPQQLFQEVEALAKLIDSRGEQAVEVIAPVHAAAVDSMLRQVFMGEPPTAGGTARSGASSSRNSTSPRSVPALPQFLRSKLGR